MDIQKLRKLLESLNVVFWNTTIDKQIAKEKLPNSTPIESARWRYVIASRKKRSTDSSIKKLPNGQVVDTLFKKQSDIDIPKLISPANKAEQAKTDKEISNLRKFLTCLEPCGLAFQRLQDEFTSSFAKDVLLTYKSKNTFKNFGGITVDNWMLCIELMVCMAHRDFWGTVLSDNTTYREINLAERILVIGVDKIRVNSDSVWNLIKELYSRGKLGLMMSGLRIAKNYDS